MYGCAVQAVTPWTGRPSTGTPASATGRATSLPGGFAMSLRLCRRLSSFGDSCSREAKSSSPVRPGGMKPRNRSATARGWSTSSSWRSRRSRKSYRPSRCPGGAAAYRATQGSYFFLYRNIERTQSFGREFPMGLRHQDRRAPCSRQRRARSTGVRGDSGKLETEDAAGRRTPRCQAEERTGLGQGFADGGKPVVCPSNNLSRKNAEDSRGLPAA